VRDLVIKSLRGDPGIYAGTFGYGDKMSVSVITKQLQSFWVRNYITLKCYKTYFMGEMLQIVKTEQLQQNIP
jgi:inosine/xanthosine triphosphate pyrophosphatase family protein